MTVVWVPDGAFWRRTSLISTVPYFRGKARPHPRGDCVRPHVQIPRAAPTAGSRPPPPSPCQAGVACSQAAAGLAGLSDWASLGTAPLVWHQAPLQPPPQLRWRSCVLCRSRPLEGPVGRALPPRSIPPPGSSPCSRPLSLSGHATVRGTLLQSHELEEGRCIALGKRGPSERPSKAPRPRDRHHRTCLKWEPGS